MVARTSEQEPSVPISPRTSSLMWWPTTGSFVPAVEGLSASDCGSHLLDFFARALLRSLRRSLSLALTLDFSISFIWLRLAISSKERPQPRQMSWQSSLHAFTQGEEIFMPAIARKT